MADLDLRKLSAPIERLRSDLSEAYKRLDEKWSSIAATLESLPIPTDVSYQFYEDSTGNQYDYLSWCKISGKKRICIERHCYYQPPEGSAFRATIIPYEEWSGQFRLDMLEHVPGLFKAAEQATQKFISLANE